VQKENPLTASDIRNAYGKAMTPTISSVSRPIPNSIVGPNINQFRPSLVELQCGIKFIYRQIPDGKIFSLCAATSGGQLAETDQTRGQFHLLAQILATATGDMDEFELAEKIEGKGGSLSGFSGIDSLGFNLSCLREDTEEFLQLFSRSLLDPCFTESQWQAALRETSQTILAHDDSAASVCVRTFRNKLFQKHSYAFPLQGSLECLEQFEKQKVLEDFKTFRDNGPWTIAAVGPQDSEEMRRLLDENLKDWMPSPTPRGFAGKQDSLPITAGDPIEIFQEREQLHMIYGVKGLSCLDPRRYALDVLVNVLSGQGGRLFFQLRETLGLAYSVSPLLFAGVDPGYVAAYLACSPDKKDQAYEGLVEEFGKLSSTLISQEELDRAQNYIIGNHEMALQSSESQATTMALMELYGLGFEEFLTYHEKINQVTAEDVMNLASELFEKQNPVTVFVGPKSSYII
jgi:zinc protease